MQVEVSLGDGTIYVGVVDVQDDEPTSDEAPARAAAVAWNAIVRNGVFTVNGRAFNADECAEWWA